MDHFFKILNWHNMIFKTIFFWRFEFLFNYFWLQIIWVVLKATIIYYLSTCCWAGAMSLFWPLYCSKEFVFILNWILVFFVTTKAVSHSDICFKKAVLLYKHGNFSLDFASIFAYFAPPTLILLWLTNDRQSRTYIYTLCKTVFYCRLPVSCFQEGPYFFYHINHCNYPHTQ